MQDIPAKKILFIVQTLKKEIRATFCFPKFPESGELIHTHTHTHQVSPRSVRVMPGSFLCQSFILPRPVYLPGPESRVDPSDQSGFNNSDEKPIDFRVQPHCILMLYDSDVTIGEDCHITLWWQKHSKNRSKIPYQVQVNGDNYS